MPTTRERILDEGLRLFASRGFAGTSVTDIERGAGLAAGSGSFYRHFASKDALFEAVIDRELDRVDAAIDKAHTDETVHADPKVALTLELQRRLVSLDRAGPLIAMLTRDPETLPAFSERLQHVIAAVTDLDVQLISSLVASNLPVRDPLGLATVLRSALVGFQMERNADRQKAGAVSSDRFIAALVELLMPRPEPDRICHRS